MKCVLASCREEAVPGRIKCEKHRLRDNALASKARSVAWEAGKCIRCYRPREEDRKTKRECLACSKKHVRRRKRNGVT